MPESINRPSKEFIKRGAIAIGVVAVLLIIQTSWFHKLVFRKEKPSIVQETVGDIVTKDTNGNGVQDWEEKLWGLDPTSLYTNGVPNADIIAQKKKALGIQNLTSTEPLDDTDRLARELFTITSALGQSEEVDSQTLGQIAAKLGNSVDIKQVNNQYSLKDIQTVPTNLASLKTYHDALRKVLTNYSVDTPDIEVLASAIQNEDASGLSTLTGSASTYRSLAKDLVAIKAPVGLAQQHLALINSFAGIGISLTYMTELNDNSIVALVGVAIYKNYSTRLTVAINSLNDYFSQYGIL